MTHDLNRTHIKQINDLGSTALRLLGCKETPVVVTNGSKITISYPLGLFTRVSSFSPPPEVFKDARINVVKGFFGARVAMVIGPAPDYRVERL